MLLMTAGAEDASMEIEQHFPVDQIEFPVFVGLHFADWLLSLTTFFNILEKIVDFAMLWRLAVAGRTASTISILVPKLQECLE